MKWFILKPGYLGKNGVIRWMTQAYSEKKNSEWYQQESDRPIDIYDFQKVCHHGRS